MRTRFFGLLAIMFVASAAMADAASTPTSDAPAATSEAATGATTTTMPATGDKILLRLNVRAGQSYDIRTTTDMKMTQVLPSAIAGKPTSGPGTPNGKIDIATVTTMTMRYDVLEVDPQGIATVKLTYSEIQNTTRTPNGDVVYDSTRPKPVSKASAPLDQVYGSLLGQSITMKIAPDGRISDVQGLENLMTRLMNSFQQPGMSPQAVAAMQKTMKESFGDQFVKSAMQQTAVLYPEKPVGVGDSWPYRITVSSSFPLAISGTRTLTARRNGISTIDEKSNISIENSAAPLQIESAKMAINIAGTQTGTTEIDETTGLTRSTQVVQRFSGTIHLQGIPQQPQGITIRIYNKTDVNVSMTPVEK